MSRYSRSGSKSDAGSKSTGNSFFDFLDSLSADDAASRSKQDKSFGSGYFDDCEDDEDYERD